MNTRSLDTSDSILSIIHNKYWKDAPTFFNRTLKYVSEPYKEGMYYSLGNYYYGKGLFDKSSEFYQKVLKINPRAFRACNNLGSTYAIKGELNQSIELFYRAIIIKPDYALAYNNLGCSYYRKKDYLNAVSVFKKALEIKPDDNEVKFNLALARQALSQQIR